MHNPRSPGPTEPGSQTPNPASGLAPDERKPLGPTERLWSDLPNFNLCGCGHGALWLLQRKLIANAARNLTREEISAVRFNVAVAALVAIRLVITLLLFVHMFPPSNQILIPPTRSASLNSANPARSRQ
jgi:hypothetical protein